MRTVFYRDFFIRQLLGSADTFRQKTMILWQDNKKITIVTFEHGSGNVVRIDQHLGTVMSAEHIGRGFHAPNRGNVGGK